MNELIIRQIIDICAEINRKATAIYQKLSVADTIDNLKNFWAEMAAEEKYYTEFWESSKKIAKSHELAYIFDNPSGIKKELEQLLNKVEYLLDRWESHHSMENALILAYRLEYYMLHPVFEVFYRTLKPLVGEFDPEITHDQRVTRFITMFVEYGSVTPELELLGETLQSLWQRNKELAKIATHDNLTGLLNRRGFLIMAKEIFYLAQRKNTNLGLLMIDIDLFKKVNDEFGHPKGDIVLRGVAESLLSSVRKSDIVGRIGGEEFVVLFPDILSPDLKSVAEKIRVNTQNKRPAGIPVTISIGLKQGKIMSDPDNELILWISQADTNLYQAKVKGRNRVEGDL